MERHPRLSERPESYLDRTFGPVTIREVLGSGAVAIAYRAEHADHGPICVKILHPLYRAHGRMLRRFRREAEAAQRIEHENVVRGHGLLELDEHQLLLSELVTGGDLDERLRGAPDGLPIPTTLRLAADIAAGLGAAHEVGLVHRDLKPANVLVDGDGRAKVADFGLVLQVEGDPLDGRTILTKQGQSVGTPRYMAPEQWLEAHEVDARCDLYALGVLTHHLCAGSPPIEGSSIGAVMAGHLELPPLRLRDRVPDAPEELERLLLALLEKKPEDRPGSAAEVRATLVGLLAAAGGPALSPPCSDEPFAHLLTEVDASSLPPALAAPPPPAGAVVSTDVFQAAPTLTDAVAPPPSRDPADGSELALAMRDERRRFGRYVLLEEIGRGGMGVVYRAFDTAMARTVALKVVLTHDSGNPVTAERFRREARAAARLRHPAILNVYEFGEREGRTYFVMDYIAGKTLDAWIADAAPSRDALVSALAQLARALDHAHRAGIVHRDVKPRNVLVDAGGRPFLMDFGIAFADDRSSQDRLTATGQLLGTPQFMAPEQLRDVANDTVGPAADIYALGTVIFEAITGTHPFVAHGPAALFRKILFDPAGPMREVDPSVPDALETIVARCLRKDPAERYGSAAALAEDLEAFVEGRPPREIAGSPTPAPTPAPSPQKPASDSAAPAAWSPPDLSGGPRARVPAATPSRGGLMFEGTPPRSSKRPVPPAMPAARLPGLSPAGFKPLPRVRPEDESHDGPLSLRETSGARPGPTGPAGANLTPRPPTPPASTPTPTAGRRRTSSGRKRRVSDRAPSTPAPRRRRVVEIAGIAVPAVVVLAALVALVAARGGDATAPTIVLAAPADGTVTNAGDVDVIGAITDEDAVARVWIDLDGVTVAEPIVEGGELRQTVPLEDEGPLRIEVHAVDPSGNESIATRTVTHDATAPTLKLTGEPPEPTTAQPSISIEGEVDDPEATVFVEIEGRRIIQPVAGHRFVATVPLATDRAMRIAILAVDDAGNESEPLVFEVTRRSTD